MTSVTWRCFEATGSIKSATDAHHDVLRVSFTTTIFTLITEVNLLSASCRRSHASSNNIMA
jgi:hypothetical protein